MSKIKDATSDKHAPGKGKVMGTISYFRAGTARGRSPSFSSVRARATRHVTDRAQSSGLELMNQYEQTAVRALLVWAANEKSAHPETVQAVTEVRFGVDHVAQLPRRDYEDVIRFLIDLRIDEMKN